MSIDWQRFKQVIDQHDRYLITSHIRPDCDALGSELGMAAVLDELGKSVMIVNGQATPPNLAFIDPELRLQTLGEEVQAGDLEDREVLMVLDTSAWAQLGPMADVVRDSSALKIVLDHHVSGDDLGAELFKDTTAEATGRLVVEAAAHLGVSLNPRMAAPLFAAQATDTGWYRYASVGGEALRIAARLVDAGAVPQDIYRELYEQDTLARLKLRGRILSRTETERNGRLAHTACLREDFVAAGALASDTEDVINETLTIAGVEVAVILVEQEQGGFKLSFRSRCELDCSQVAEEFGGGGHKAAAGAFIDEPFETARRQVLDAVLAAMKD
ncbi:MAG: bifunctional oligoribonuclease/PAP phosphatase NrnA [Planctomycetales bacterium]|nr:bifunctional oligoribonuclease/PAP phosphatase NrnA [Planctomycetales bacterium]NIM09537.1 bifunctional oligoribonuclease/PAP phosphatase NrnA [Planctomycetales bacterium]NIN07374.1 bifunctional oligoribonuclease/PAP phosphatase NrnA [Planctomycetales bacterium]NIN76478.1 bifunctional oligoribonuclease/PAP phosphatase NrnA [Planctomycetales bacterium]NIO35325.1 bifunctional oligoribonuclease/PAP phosphatase NrnA [Planctomycetales bacterium]